MMNRFTDSGAGRGWWLLGWVCLAAWAAGGANYPEVDAYVQLAGDMETALQAADTNQVATLYPQLEEKQEAVTTVLENARYRVEAAYQRPLAGAAGGNDPYVAAMSLGKKAGLYRSFAMFAINDYVLMDEPPTREVAIEALTNGVASTLAADIALGDVLAPFAGTEVPPRLVLTATGPETASRGEAIRIDCTLRNAGDQTAEDVTIRAETTWEDADKVQEAPLRPLPGQQEIYHAVYIAMPKDGDSVGVVVSAGASNTGGAHARVAIKLD